jgi:hypothetical protein
LIISSRLDRSLNVDGEGDQVDYFGLAYLG